ncbi:MAG: polysaccharide biosynthesis tyrosine autokinase [Verrucomicrobia bacterium]|nr:polysaccharide biosynthesis tyrosine autokinase [Verrucomicrobiota bacterium]
MPAAQKTSTISLASKIYRWRVLLARRWWVLLLCMSVAVCVMAILLKNRPEKFESTGRLWISGRITLGDGGGAKVVENEGNFIATQIALLQSDKVKVAALTHLQTFNPELRSSDVLVNIAQNKNSDMIQLEAIGFEPKFTRAYLDAVMEEYLYLRTETRTGTFDKKALQMQEELQQRKKELDAAADRFNTFRSENSLDILRALNAGVAESLGTMNRQLNEIRIDLESLKLLTPESQLENRAPKPGTPNRDGADPLVAKTPYHATQEKIDVLRFELDERSEVLKPAHPKMIDLTEQIERLEKTLDLYKKRGLNAILAQRTELETKRQTIEERIKELEGTALLANAKMTQHDKLKEALLAAQKEYDRVADQVKSITSGSTKADEPVKILEKASEAQLKERKLAQNIAIAAIAGLLLGLGILFLLDKMDDRINTSNELLDAVSEEILGQIPEQETKRKEKNIPLLQPDEERHAFAEAYRNVRSSLLFLDTPEFKPRTFVITSSIPSEGKSTVSTNLALTLANAGQRVLLIDADLRRGALKDLLGVKADFGLTEVLRGKAEWFAAVKPTANEKLFLIPRGAATNKAGELFLTRTMDDLLREAPQKFDYVFIDSAPILATDDTATFAPKIDGVLFVLRASYTGSRALRTSIEQLRSRGANVLGLVFNRISESMPDYQYYKYSEYYATKEND